VYTPMAMTIISISPCLHVDLKRTSSLGFFVASIDFLVSADWTTKGHGKPYYLKKLTIFVCFLEHFEELVRTTKIMTELHDMLFNLFEISMNL
jgi:hypothetical protein